MSYQEEQWLPAHVLDTAIKGDAQAVAAWLDEGGGVDARCVDVEGTPTLLMAGAMAGQEAVVRMLLQRSASVHLQDSYNGTTALMAAALYGHTTTVQSLLDGKADTSLQATNGRTALMAAEQKKHTATAQLLRQHTRRQAAEAEAKAAASPTRAAAAADAMAAELLAEAEEKETAAKKTGKSKKKKEKAAPTSTRVGGSAATNPLASKTRPAAAELLRQHAEPLAVEAEAKAAAAAVELLAEEAEEKQAAVRKTGKGKKAKAKAAPKAAATGANSSAGSAPPALASLFDAAGRAAWAMSTPWLHGWMGAVTWTQAVQSTTARRY